MARMSFFQAIRHHEEPRGTGQAAASDMRVYRSSYQNQLRLIGMHLDNNDLRRARILEVPGGYLLRATGPDTITDELLEFPDGTFEQYFEEAISHRRAVQREHLRIKTDLIPTSYSDVLRAIGATLDRWMARSIVISEGSDGIYVSGLRLQDTSTQSRYAPFDAMLSPETVDEILTAAHARRGSGF